MKCPTHQGAYELLAPEYYEQDGIAYMVAYCNTCKSFMVLLTSQVTSDFNQFTPTAIKEVVRAERIKWLEALRPAPLDKIEQERHDDYKWMQESGIGARYMRRSVKHGHRK